MHTCTHTLNEFTPKKLSEKPNWSTIPKYGIPLLQQVSNLLKAVQLRSPWKIARLRRNEPSITLVVDVVTAVLS